MTQIERRLPGAVNKIDLNKAYVAHALTRFITRAEYEAGEWVTAPLVALPGMMRMSQCQLKMII